MSNKNSGPGYIGGLFVIMIFMVFIILWTPFRIFPFIGFLPVMFIFIGIIGAVSASSAKANRFKPVQKKCDYYHQQQVPSVNPYIERNSDYKPIESEKLKALFCQFCGTRIEEDDHFCHQCGSKMG